MFSSQEQSTCTTTYAAATATAVTTASALNCRPGMRCLVFSRACVLHARTRQAPGNVPVAAVLLQCCWAAAVLAASNYKEGFEMAKRSLRLACLLPHPVCRCCWLQYCCTAAATSADATAAAADDCNIKCAAATSTAVNASLVVVALSLTLLLLLLCCRASRRVGALTARLPPTGCHTATSAAAETS